ncbi:MAG: cupin [Planctomycetota bacterium]|nr:MAG: cupin [Planctomycetota bacterium]
MSPAYKYLADLDAEMSPPEDGTLSRTIYQDDGVKAVLFGFGAGQELSEHTASVAAVMHFLKGEADVTLGADSMAVGPGAWFHMAPQLPHSIRAKTPVVMLLLLLKGVTRPAS